MDTQRRWGLGEAWIVVGAAAALLAVTQGFRASFGLFLSPINSTTGLGLATISFALAASQLASGVAQPFAARLAERFGHPRTIVFGAIATAAGIAALPWLGSGATLTLGLVLVAVAGTVLASAPVLVAAVIALVPPARQGRASGIVSAGGSAGQLIVGPSTQAGIAQAGWVATLFALAAVTLASGALARAFRRPVATATATGRQDDAAAADAEALRASRSAALRDPSFWYLAASFFVCGFHVSFLLAHMPGFIDMCGLPPSLSGAWLAIIGVCNIAGSIASGFVIERVSPRAALVVLYTLRGLIVLAFAAIPPTAENVVFFTVGIGLTYMATLPPTTALVGSLYGTRNVAMLFGMIMLLHQVGSFLGVWLGGVVLDATGVYDAMWLVDGGLALLAAVACLGIRETRRNVQVLRPAARPAQA